MRRSYFGAIDTSDPRVCASGHFGEPDSRRIVTTSLAEMLGQIPPGNAGLADVNDRIDEEPVGRFVNCDIGISRLTRQQMRDLLKVFVLDLVTARREISLTSTA